MNNEPNMPNTDTPHADVPQAPHRPAPPRMPRKTMKAFGLLIMAAVVILVGGILLFATMRDDNQGSQSTTTGQRTEDKWYAVFLTNGQVYFGHLPKVEAEQLELNNIYYLQVEQRLQPPENQQQTQQPNVSLVKLGRSELHCPVDKMTINRDQVLFWEELKTESKVVQAITEYLKTDDATKACYEGLNQQQNQ